MAGEEAEDMEAGEVVDMVVAAGEEEDMEADATDVVALEGAGVARRQKLTKETEVKLQN